MEHRRVTLPNGLRLMHAHMPGVHSVSVAVFVGLGSRYEPDAEAGAAHLIEHMLFKGTERRPRAALVSETLDSVGGILNASTDKEATVYWAKVAREHLPLALDLLSDMLRHSRLRPADLTREKRVVVEELRMLADDPQDWAHVLIDEALWPQEPVGREVAGSPSTVLSLRRATLMRYMTRYYGPNNAVVSVAGGVPLDDVAARVDEVFGDWERVSAPPPAPAAGGTVAHSRLDFKPTEQLHLCLGFPALPREHPDSWALDLLCTILGGGTSSRLFLGLRERLGLAYEVHAYTEALADTGALVVYTGVDPPKAQRAVDEVFRILDGLARRGPTDRELANAKQYFRGRLFLGLEDTQAVASWYGGQELLQGHVEGPEDVAARVASVTAADVRRLARQYLDPGLARMSAVGPTDGLALDARLGA